MANEDIFRVVRDGKPDAIQVIRRIPDINVLDRDRRNPLFEAIVVGNLPIAEELIRLRINVNCQDSAGQTPLHFTGHYNRPDFARLILSNGGDLSIVDKHGNTALWSAVFSARGNFDTIQVLLEFGGAAVMNKMNSHGRSPLILAEQFGDQPLIDLLRSFL